MLKDYLALSHASKQCDALVACGLTALRAEFAASRLGLCCASVSRPLALSVLISVCTTRQSLYNPTELPRASVRLDPSVTKAH